MSKNLTRFILNLFFTLIISCSFAYADSPIITIEQPWIRWLPGDTPAAGYFTLHNSGSKPAILKSVESPAFAHIHLHRSVIESGIARMEMLDQLNLPAEKSLFFAPGGLHLMLMHPKKNIKPGDQVPIKFSLLLPNQQTKSIEILFPVRSIGQSQ